MKERPIESGRAIAGSMSAAAELGNHHALLTGVVLGTISILETGPYRSLASQLREAVQRFGHPAAAQIQGSPESAGPDVVPFAGPGSELPEGA